MNSRARRKTSARRFALVFASVLLNSSAAFAAGLVEDGQTQAGALLAGAPGSRTDHASDALPSAASAAAVEPQDQARALLARPPHFTPAERLLDVQESVGGLLSPASNHGGAYAGAQESARRMILGRGA